MYKIISHNDLDGYGSAYIVKRNLMTSGVSSDMILTINTDYSKELSLNDFDKDDILFITDFSLKPDFMNALYQRGLRNITWIDHHKTAIDYKQDYLCYESILGLQEVGISATGLAWIYFNAPDDIKEMGVEQQEQWLNVSAPKWVNLIDAWDCWKLNSKYREESEYLNIAVGSILSYKLIERLYDNKYLDSYIKKGRIYTEYMEEYNKSYLNSCKYEITINIVNHKAYSGIVINRKACGSKVFGKELSKYDFGVSYVSDGEKIKASIYSTNPEFDCSKVCKALGGGGHKGAAGFILDWSDLNLYEYFHKDAEWVLKIDNWEEDD